MVLLLKTPLIFPFKSIILGNIGYPQQYSQNYDTHFFYMQPFVNRCILLFKST